MRCRSTQVTFPSAVFFSVRVFRPAGLIQLGNVWFIILAIVSPHYRCFHRALIRKWCIFSLDPFMFIVRSGVSACKRSIDIILSMLDKRSINVVLFPLILLVHF